MGCHSFASLVVIVATIFLLQVHCSPIISHVRGICATENPDASFLNSLLQVKSDEARLIPAGSEARQSPIEIETWFHIISSRSEVSQVSDDMINSQLAILQNAYEDADITYRLRGITRHVNDLWAQNGDDLGMKQAVRQGTYQTLNVYFQTDLRASVGQDGRIDNGGTIKPKDLATSVLGFCTLPDPQVNASSSPTDYVKDGCNILAKTMPGGSLDLYNRGGTAIHEIGHWNGLLHTFQGESCSGDNPGDYIPDTPQQYSPTDGCPVRRDSCPSLPGVDLVHNFMDYSSDVCYESFTPGQIQRMRSMWAAMRAGK
ncbi:hypothetical protein N7495_008911 [Penicillium taxi]|uniref:uncharacterized protein n=1 Tax=Penicillium taxi TaxID=168475 RepID=UPI002544DCEF|nr:uncharacterized protein N7495_008911 [Penicillium taxi]KAJ5888870.1 hypothetical protein N7495_008911 [Penicillium taxi]